MRSLVLAACVLFLAGMNEAFAHGGSHPTPGPPPPLTPPDTPVPPPGPTPTPTPGPTPSPTPRPGGPTPSPTPGPGRGTPGLTPTTDTPVPWVEWWFANQWRFLRVDQSLQVETGTGGEIGQQLDLVHAFLRSCLDNSYFDVKAAACLALGKAGDGSAAKDMIPLLRNKNEDVRKSAMLGLGMLGHQECVAQLAEVVLNRKMPQGDRVHAAVALGLAGGAAAEKALFEAFVTEDSDKTGMTIEIRAAACLGLGMMKSSKAIAPMARMIENPKADERLRAMCAAALGKYGQPSVQVEEGEVPVAATLLSAMQPTQDPQVRRTALMALGSVWYEGLGTSLLDMHRSEPDGWVRSLSLLVAAEHEKNPSVVQALHRRLDEIFSDGPKARSLLGFAAVAAGLSRHEAAAPALQELFRDGKDEHLRAAAAVGLGFLGHSDSIPLILNGMRSSQSQALKSFCCVSFALMGKADQAVSSELRAILSDLNNTGDLRSTASIALAKIGDRQAVRMLLDYVDRGDKRTRQLMVSSVGFFRDIGVFPPLKASFDAGATDNETRALIVVALGNIAEIHDPPALKSIFRYYNYLLVFPNLEKIFRLM